jgi:hypothetical protein
MKALAARGNEVSSVKITNKKYSIKFTQRKGENFLNSKGLIVTAKAAGLNIKLCITKEEQKEQ